MAWTVRRISRAMLPILFALTIVEIGSGLVLDSIESTLLRYPSLLVLVPVTIGTAGNLGSILAARLSTAFHLGLLEFSASDDRFGGNALATVVLAACLFPPIGAGAWALSSVTTSPQLALSTVVLVATISGLGLGVLAVVVTVIATYSAYRLELDPDDIVIPIVTNVCDVLGVVVLFIVVTLVV